MAKTTAPSPSERLLRAADIIEAAMAEMDTSHTTCPNCRQRIASNYVEFKLAEQFSWTPKKLRDAADKLADNARHMKATGHQSSQTGEDDEYDGGQDY